nr:immunoglobulin heavy chain junction region [Mus musculus]
CLISTVGDWYFDVW